MSEETFFIVVVIGILSGAFVVSGAIEIVGLNRSGWISNGKTVLYVALSNALAAVLTGALAVAMIGLFLLLFSAALGGAGLMVILALVGGLLALVIAPALFSVSRLVTQKVLSISKEEITLNYTVLISIANLVFSLVFLFGIFAVLTGLSSIF